LSDLYQALGLVSLFGVIALALIAGRRPERVGAGLLLAAVIATWVAQSLLGSIPVLMLAIDGAFCVALLVLLAVYKRFWIGCAACAQSVLLAFSSTRMTHFPLTESEYVLMLSLGSFGVYASLFVGTILSRWGRPADADAELWGY